MSLNVDQLRAVEAEGDVLVVACPGSGKTKLLVEKIRYILAKRRDARIIVVTFSRKSAEEIEERAIAEIGETAARRSCRFGTFHGHAIRQLTAAKKMKRLLKASEQYEYMRRAWLSLNDDNLSMEDAIQMIESCKCLVDFKPEDNIPGKLFLAYTALTTRNGVMDFSDTIVESVRMMRSGDVPPLGGTHFLVDEFQDTDAAQLSWLQEHQKTGAFVTGVGDDDQSIYSWRNAMGYAGMIKFADACSAVKVTLGTNYRCRSEILLHAERLIANNPDRIGKRLFANRGSGGAVEILRFGDELEEAEAIASKVIETGRPTPKKWAVLARTNLLLEAVDGTFRAQGIPFFRSGGTSFWDNPKMPGPSLLLALLESVQSGRIAGIDRIFHWCGVQDDDLETFHRLAAGGIDKVTEETVRQSDLGTFAKSLLGGTGGFMVLFHGWRKETAAKRYLGAILGAGDWMVDHVRNDTNGLQAKLIKIATGILTSNRMEGTLLQRVARVTTKTSKKDKGDKEEKDGVGLYTVHSSKGLEFENVWVVGAEKDVFPSPKSAVQEERRLMYVAITRAKDRLYISSSAANPESPFIEEARGR